MKVTQSLVELMVEDVETSVKFYQDVLGFSLLAHEEEAGKKNWALTQLNGFQISFKEAKRLRAEVPYLEERKMGGSAIICFQVDDLEAYYQAVKTSCELLDHPHLTPCGARAFSMLDNSGYILTIERFGAK